MDGNNIVCCIHPFLRYHNIDVYKDGGKVLETKSTLDELELTLYGLAMEYKINDISIGGNGSWRPIGEKIRRTFKAEKYANKGINIIMMER